MCPLQSSLPLPPSSWFKLHHSLKIPHTFWGGIHPKQLNMLYLSLEFLGYEKNLNHGSLSSPCKTESITWNLHDKSSALIKFPIAKRASVFCTSIWHCPPPQSLSVFISWGNVELHSHEVRHPKNIDEALQKMPRKCQWWLQTHRQVVPGDPRSEGTEDTEGSLHSKGSTGYTFVQSESLRKSVGQIPGNPAEQWQWYYRNESLCQGRALVQNLLLFWGLRLWDTYSSGDPGRLAQPKPVACSSRGDSIELSIIWVNRSAEDRWNLSQHLHLHDWWDLGTSKERLLNPFKEHYIYIIFIKINA